MRIIFVIYFLITVISLSWSVAPATSEAALVSPKGDLTVAVNKLRSNRGEIRVALFNSKSQFLKLPYQAVTQSIVAQKARVDFSSLDYGEYALAVFHDKNTNGRLDTNFLGMPQEPYGFSNNARSFMGPPDYEAVKFSISQREIVVTINLE